MYILFAIVVSSLVYFLLAVGLRIAGRDTYHRRLLLISLGTLALTLLLFNLTSRSLGIDLGPGYPVSYRIPEDYLFRGTGGWAALVPYTLACLSPVVAWVVLPRRA